MNHIYRLKLPNWNENEDDGFFSTMLGEIQQSLAFYERSNKGSKFFSLKQSQNKQAEVRFPKRQHPRKMKESCSGGKLKKMEVLQKRMKILLKVSSESWPEKELKNHLINQKSKRKYIVHFY